MAQKPPRGVFIDPITHTPMVGGARVDHTSGKPKGTFVGRSYIPPKATPKKPDLTPQQAEAKAMQQARANVPIGDPAGTPSISDVQKFLKGKGYAIKVDGQLGPQTKSAIADWHKGVAGRNPKAWSAAQGQVPASPDNKGGGKGANPGGSGSNPGRVPAAAGTTGKLPAPPTLPSGQQLDPNAWQALKTYDPSAADSMAGAQFDPQIQQTKLMQAEQPLDLKQALHDINHWYGQVGTSLGTANTRNAAASKTAVGDIGAATQAILSSLGGAANSGASMIAGQGDANAAAQAQLGQAEQQYQNDLAPLLKDEAAGQLTNQQNLGNKTKLDLAQQLSSLMGQRGQAKTNALMQILQLNNGVLGQQIQGQQGAEQYNNTLGQQNYQNQVTQQELAQAAALNNANVNYYTAAAKAQAGAGQGFIPWAKLNAAQKQQLINSAIASISDPTGSVLPQYQKNTTAAWMAARQALRGQGYNSAFKNTASDPAAYGQITDLLQGGLNRAYGIYQQRVAATGQ